MSLTKVTYSMIEGAMTNVLDYGAIGDGVADDTAALTNAYAAAVATTKTLYLPAGIYKITSQLVWDSPVNVIGVAQGTTLLKTGNFDGIYIGAVDGSGGSVVYSGFRIHGAAGNGGKGIVLRNISYATLENLFIFNHASDGLYLDDTTGGIGMYHNTFDNITITTNGGHGLVIDSTGNNNSLGACNVCYFNNLAITANTGIGFYQFGQASGASGYHYGGNNTCEQNVGGGVSLNGISNQLSFYLEVNTAFDLKLDTTSVRNYITLIATTVALQDFGTNNFINDIAFNNVALGPGVGAPKQAANVAGRGFGIQAGAGGDGATAVRGGDLSLFSGSAGGTTGNANSGDIIFAAGIPKNAGNGGTIYMDPYNQSIFSFGSFSGSNTSTQVKFGSTTRVPLFAPLSSAQIAALTPLAGMVAYNGTTNKLQCYDGSGWQDLF
jgi:hypothetical protein